MIRTIASVCAIAAVLGACVHEASAPEPGPVDLYDPLDESTVVKGDGDTSSTFTGNTNLQMFGIWIYLGTDGPKHLWFNNETLELKVLCERYNAELQVTEMVPC